MQITDPVMVRSLVRDEAATYLAPFLHDDHSVSEAAALLRLPLARVHYWVRSLYDVGLLEVVAETPRKGRAIKRYRAIATEFVVPAESMPDDYFARVMRRTNAEMTEALTAAGPEWVVAGDFRISATSPVRGSRERMLKNPQGPRVPIHQSGRGLWITEAQALELIDEITALSERWVEISDDAGDLQLYQLEIALAPMPG